MIEVQYRVWFDKADPDMMGCRWRPDRPTEEELAEWRSDFAVEIYVQRRTVMYGPVERC